MENTLEVKNIHTFIGQFHILEGVSITVQPETITVLLGRNGAGKTTTLKSILGLTPPREGVVTFDGKRFRENGLMTSPAWASAMCLNIGLFFETSRWERI